MRPCPQWADVAPINCNRNTHHQSAPIHLITLSGNWFVVLTHAKMAPPYVALLFVKLHRVASKSESSCAMKTYPKSNGMCCSKKNIDLQIIFMSIAASLPEHTLENPHTADVHMIHCQWWNWSQFESSTENGFKIWDTLMQLKRRTAVMVHICSAVSYLGKREALSEHSLWLFSNCTCFGALTTCTK